MDGMLLMTIFEPPRRWCPSPQEQDEKLKIIMWRGIFKRGIPFELKLVGVIYKPIKSNYRLLCWEELWQTKKAKN
jgi:hypothetical protein